VISVKMDINVDEKGNFMGVTIGDNTYSPDAWNKMQKEKPNTPSSNEKKK